MMGQTTETSFPISSEALSPKVLMPYLTPSFSTVYEDPHIHWLTTGNCLVPSVEYTPKCRVGGWYPKLSPNTISSFASRLIDW